MRKSGIQEGIITTDSIDIKKIITECYNQFYSHNFDELDEMDKFLQKIPTTKAQLIRKR